MESLFEIFSNIPWWVYVIFGYVLFIGINALKSQVIPIKRVFIIPLIFVVWSFFDLVQGFIMIDILIWLISLAIGGIVGFYLARLSKIQADHKKALIKIEGSPFITHLWC